MDLKHQADASVLQSWGIRVLDTATGASALGAYLLRYSATVHHGKPDFWTSATHLLSWAMASVAIFTSEIIPMTEMAPGLPIHQDAACT